MGLSLQLFAQTVEVRHAAFGECFRPRAASGESLHFLQRYFRKKNAVRLHHLQLLQCLPHLRDFNEDDAYDFVKFEDVSSSWRMRRSGTIPGKVSPARSRQKKAKGQFQLMPEVTDFAATSNSRRKKQQPQGGMREGQVQWNDLVFAATGGTEQQLLRLVDGMKPLLVVVVKHEHDFFLATLTVVGLKHLQSPRGAYLDDYRLELEIVSRSWSTVLKEELALTAGGDFLEVLQHDVKDFVTKRITNSLLSKPLREKMRHRIAHKAVQYLTHYTDKFDPVALRRKTVLAKAVLRDHRRSLQLVVPQVHHQPLMQADVKETRTVREGTGEQAVR